MSLPRPQDPGPQPALSIVVPVLDEATGVGSFPRHLPLRAPAAEIVVVNGGSRDASHVARGSVLWFLEATSRLPAGGGEAIAAAPPQPTPLAATAS